MRKLLKRKLVTFMFLGYLPLASSCMPKVTSYDVPADMWKVHLVPAPHVGEPLLRVTIDERFSWPKPVGEPPQPVYYRITLSRPKEKPIKDVGRLTADERFAVVLVAPSRLAAELTLDPSEDRRQMQERLIKEQRAVEALGKEGRPAPDDLVERLEVIIRTHGIEVGAEERAAVLEYELELVPYAGDRGLVRQETTKKEADPPKYKWGEVVTRDNDPCKGKTPEVCAREKLQKIKEQICNAKKPDGTPRFPDECARLTAMLAKTPPEPKVECLIPAEKGVTAGEMNSLTGVIILNGEYFLTGSCAEATVLHELQHVIDLMAGKKENIKKIRDAEERMEKAIEDGKAAKAAGDQAGLAKARDNFAKAKKDAQAVEQAAGEEQIQDECRALFITVDNGDLFGYPGEGNAWMKENIKGMVGELSKIRRDFNLPWGSPPVKGALCNCFKKIRDWVNGQPVIKKNFDTDIFREEPPKATWSEAISRLTDKYCQ